MADAELLAVFKAEVEDQIEDLCRRLEAPPGDWRIEKLFQLSHNIKGAARVVGIDGIRDSAHVLEDLFGAIRDGAVSPAEAGALARDGARLLEASFAAMDAHEQPDVADFRRKVSELIGAPAHAEPAGTRGVEAVAIGHGSGVDADVVVSRAASSGRRSEETLRVGAEKLDALMGLASEFVTEVFRAEERSETIRRIVARLDGLLKRSPALAEDPDMIEVAKLSRGLRKRTIDDCARTARISEQLQESVRLMRMVRIDGLAGLLNRSLREATRLYGNRAELRVKGGQTEVDRAVLTQLRDPLTHLVRNAVSHGIEPPEERRARNKDEVGAVTVEAHSVGSWVELAVTDDGRGVDPVRVREHALRTGLVGSDELATLTDEGVLDLLTQPGFSTASTVTELAGRGVGLDVVRTNLAEIGGSVGITSRLGEGTRVVLRLPLTRLTTLGIVVRVGQLRLAAPTADVERTLVVQGSDISTVDGIEVVSVHGGLIPVSHLGEALSTPYADAETLPAVVLTDGRRRRAMLVDEVVGERELVVHALSWNLRGAFGLAGTSVIEGDQVVLLLDSRQLLLTAREVPAAAGTQPRQRKAEIRRILVVDDSATTRTLEVNILRSAGYEVSAAPNGVEALFLLNNGRFDLAVVDVQMPMMDGLELTRKIRATEPIRHLPVVLVTSLGDEADKRRGAEAGADAYIVKGDFDQEELLQVVSRLL